MNLSSRKGTDMARRAATNERYQKQNSKLGSTRKSASSAKPKRAAGTISSSAEKTKAKPEKKKSTYTPPPSTPEMQKWRRIWYVLLGIAIAGFAVALYAKSNKQTTLEVVAVTVEMIAVGVAIGIDVVIIRKLRAQAIAAKSMGKKKTAKLAEKAASKTSGSGDNGADAS